jgi:hypothetical protein
MIAGCAPELLSLAKERIKYPRPLKMFNYFEQPHMKFIDKIF